MQDNLHKNDIFVDTAGQDAFDGGDGYDTVIYLFRSSPLHITLSGPDSSTVYVEGIAEDTLCNIEDIVGGFGHDILKGDHKDNKLFGMSGDDRLYGGGGPDHLEGGNGKDFVDGGDGIDFASYRDKDLPVQTVLSGLNETTVYVGGVAEDTLRNIESLQGGADADTLTGDNNSNTLIGMAGDDLLYGKAGSDALQGNAGEDFLDGGEGVDWALYKDKQARVSVELSDHRDSKAYIAGVAEDTLRSIESLQGGMSHDYLMGNDADNTLEGREGTDMLMGRGGSDHFLYTDASHGNDIIWDFTRNEDDKIHLDFFSSTPEGHEPTFTDQSPEPFSVWYEITGDGGGNRHTMIKADTDGDEQTVEFTVVLVRNVPLTADDFILT